jgi:hypothetical protein
MGDVTCILDVSTLYSFIHLARRFLDYLTILYQLLRIYGIRLRRFGRKRLWPLESFNPMVCQERPRSAAEITVDPSEIQVST